MVSQGNFPNFQNFPNRLFLDFFLLFWSICLSWWKIVEIFTNLKKKTQKKGILKIWNISLVSHRKFFQIFQIFQIACFLIFFLLFLVNLSLSWWKIVEIVYKFKEKPQKKRFWKFGKFPWFHKEIFQTFKIFQIACFLIFFHLFWSISVYLDEK